VAVQSILPCCMFNMMPGHMLATQYLHKELYHPDLLLAAKYESETYHNKQPNILWKDFCHCVILSWQRTIFQDSCATTKTKPATCTKFGLSNVVLRQIASISRFRPPTPILKLQSITAWLAWHWIFQYIVTRGEVYKVTKENWNYPKQLGAP